MIDLFHRDVAILSFIYENNDRDYIFFGFLIKTIMRNEWSDVRDRIHEVLTPETLLDIKIISLCHLQADLISIYGINCGGHFGFLSRKHP